MREVIDDGRMPPWHADPQHGKFFNDARLTRRREGTCSAMGRQRLPEGDAADLPEPTKFTDGWQIPKPDVVINMPKAFTVPAKGTVEYQYFDVEPKLDRRQVDQGGRGPAGQSRRSCTT